ncbi:glutamate--tRNA ligase [Arcobacter sp. YIC-464]|uniref:glutamate--tRNA ligase n=1 Tax=Arcobacter sp. YIC-464 TaxID=3376631 RepID=UPI003C18ABB6
MFRFAPSPTRSMNLSDLRVAIFNYIVSKQKNEDLVVRIEDIDKDKVIEGKDKEILEILNLFSIDYSRAAHQSDSLKYHQKMAMQLMAQKKAFACFCGDVKLDELKEEAQKEGKPFKYDGFCQTLSDETVLNTNAPFTVRVVEPSASIRFTDLLQGDFKFKPLEMDSFVILNHDKTPTYDYACAVDDMIMDISTVIRNDEYLSSTANQIHIRKCLSYDKKIDYIHIPTIEKADEISIKTLIEDGFLPSAIANYLVLLGNKTPKEIFTLEEAIEWFDITKISKETISFDLDKLKQINKKHLEILDDMRLSKILGYADVDLGKLGKIFLEDCSTIKELKSNVDNLFAQKVTYEGYEKEFVEIKLCIQDAPFFEKLDDLIVYVSKKTEFKGKSLEKPLSFILTAQDDYSKLKSIYPLIKNYIGEIAK